MQDAKIGTGATPAVVFLDFDGVIVTFRHWMSLDRKGVMTEGDPVVGGMLARLHRESGCLFVVSSSWRRLHTKEECVGMLVRAGVPETAIHPDWQTPKLAHGFRGLELEDWLKAHPEVVRHFSLDDSSDYLPDHLVVTCPTYDGMGFWQYVALEALLKDLPVPAEAEHVVLKPAGMMTSPKTESTDGAPSPRS